MHWLCTFLILLSLPLVLWGQEVVLYDAELGTLPNNQGWLWLSDPFFDHMASQNMVDNTVELDTTFQSSDSSGYFNTGHPMAPTLDCTNGFTLKWEVQVLSEQHSSTDRAGFSVIAICSDLSGLEVGLWTNEIWVQNDVPLFTHGEGAGLNTSQRANQYELMVHQSNYTIRVNGTNLLTGIMRDYSAFDGFPDPYETPNLIFFGDDTGSANARIRLSKISFLPWASPPALGPILISNSSNTATLSVEHLSDGYRYTWESSTSLTSDWTFIDHLDAASSSTNVVFPISSIFNQLYYRLNFDP